MTHAPNILSTSDAPPFVVIIWVVVIVVIAVVRLVGSLSRKTQATPKPPPAPPIPQSLFAGVQANRLVAPPPPPRFRRPRRLPDVMPPPPPRPGPQVVAKAPESSDFPEAKVTVSGAQTVRQTAGRPSLGPSILDELRSPAAIRSAIILTELMERPAVLRDEPGRPE